MTLIVKGRAPALKEVMNTKLIHDNIPSQERSKTYNSGDPGRTAEHFQNAYAFLNVERNQYPKCEEKNKHTQY